MEVDTKMTTLSRSLVVEIAGAFGLRNNKLAQGFIRPLFRPVTDRLAQIGLTFDRNAREIGFSKAMGVALEDFASSVTARGTEQLPPAGPLLVVSNHPGNYDSLVIGSQLKRDDLNFISGDIPFLRTLPEAYQHFFCVSDKDNGRTVAALKAIRHLKNGGALLLYGAGHIDPDPAVYEDAEPELDRWSPSIELFLKTIPETKILPTIVSHVVFPKYRNSILYRLRTNPVDKRRLVEFGQIIYQLLFPRRLRSAPFISFAELVGADELRHESGTSQILPALIKRAKNLLADHMAWVKAITNR